MTDAAFLIPPDLDPSVQPLDQEEANGLRFELWLAADQLTAWASATLRAAHADVDGDAFERLLRRARLVIDPQRQSELLARLHAVLEKEPPVGAQSPAVPVAAGRAPVPGEDGRLEWHVESAEEAYQRLVAEAEAEGRAVNFRERRKVVNVTQQSPLVTLHPPTPGMPGTDVFGGPLAPRAGAPAEICAHAGVEVTAGGTKFMAATDGCVRWDGRNLSVDPVYVVAGTVDFREGNVQFQGSVRVEGEVQPGFSVDARDDLEVRGVAERCTLKSGGAMTLSGGYTGGDQVRIHAVGPLSARYLTNALVDADDDCLVQSQIINCRVNALGRVIVTDGAVIGGRVAGLGGLDLAIAGAANGTRTDLVVSLEGCETDEIRELGESLQNLETKLDQINRRIGPLIEDPNKLAALPDAQKAVVAQLLEFAERLEAERDGFAARRNELVKALRERVGNQVIIRKTLHPGVSVTIDTCRQVFAQSLNGPLLLKPNYGAGTLGVRSLPARGS